MSFINDQWNPATAAMPPEAIEVLVCCQQGTHQWMTVAHFTAGKWHGDDAVSVTHWRALPAYPRLETT